MRILLVNYEFPTTDPACGGGGRVTELLADGLADRGHDVRVLTDNASAGGEHVHGPERSGHWATFPLRGYGDARRLVDWADVVNGHFSLPSSLGLPWLCRRADTPLVVSVMGADVYDPTRFELIRPAADAVNRQILGAADAVVAPSEDMHTRVAQYGLGAEVIHYGIDTDRWDWRERERHDPVRILTVCRLVERKRLDAAVGAVSTLRSEHGVRARHRIVGDGPLRETVKEWATRPWVEYRGYADDLQAEYDWADLFFLPSAHEAFGMVFCEALACGLPVVTSPWGGQTDIVTSAVGRYPDTKMGGTLADSLQRVVADYDHFQWETDGHVEALFSAEQMVDDYDTLFQNL